MQTANDPNASSDRKILTGLELLLLAAFSTSLVLILSLVFFAGPAEDDFTIWKMVREYQGVFATVQGYYRIQTGRWAGTFISGLIAWKIDYFQGYGVMLLGVAFVSLVGWIAFVRACLGTQISWLRTAGCGLILQALVFAGSPALSETVYWLNGALYYPLGFALGQIVFSGCLIYSRSPALPVALQSGVAGVLVAGSLAIGGFNEVLAVWWVLILSLSAGLAFRLQSPYRWFWGLMLASGIGGLLLAALAPGNSLRLVAYESPDSISALGSLIFRLFASQMSASLGNWILDAKLLLLSAVYLLWPVRRLPMPEWIRNSELHASRWMIGFWIGCLCLGFLIPSFALRQAMPERTLSALHGWFFMGWWLFLSIHVRPLAQRHLDRVPALNGARTGFVALLALSLFFSGNTARVIHEFRSGVVERHHRHYEELHRLLGSAKRYGTQDARVPELPMTSELLYRQAVSTDPDHIGNQHLCCYYGFNSVRVIPDGNGHGGDPAP